MELLQRVETDLPRGMSYSRLRMALNNWGLTSKEFDIAVNHYDSLVGNFIQPKSIDDVLLLLLAKNANKAQILKDWSDSIFNRCAASVNENNPLSNNNREMQAILILKLKL